MSLLLKVFIMSEGTSRGPDFSLAALLQPYQAQIVRQQLSPRRWRRRIRRAFQDWNRLLDVLPSDLADILGQLKRGRFWPFGCQFTRCRRADGALAGFGTQADARMYFATVSRSTFNSRAIRRIRHPLWCKVKIACISAIVS